MARVSKVKHSPPFLTILRNGMVDALVFKVRGSNSLMPKSRAQLIHTTFLDQRPQNFRSQFRDPDFSYREEPKATLEGSPLRVLDLLATTTLTSKPKQVQDSRVRLQG